MATILNTFISSSSDIVQFLKDEADPRTKHWFMLGSPWLILSVLGFYLLFTQKIGPSIMAKRKPMNLDRIMQIYDIMQILLNSYVFYYGLRDAWLRDYSYKCQPVDRSNNPKAVMIASLTYFYFMLKILDLLDTVFFVLRKKDHQISFLHVYHHGGMIITAWMCVRYVPGGHGTLVGLINAFVHMVMYTHYLVMSLKISKPWWKKYITQLQLIQFFVVFFHLSQLFFRECDFPLWLVIIFLPQNVFMIVLFGDFYYKTYIKKPSKKIAVEQNGQAKETSNSKSKTQ